jgi:hypothetical protein
METNSEDAGSSASANAAIILDGGGDYTFTNCKFSYNKAGGTPRGAGAICTCPSPPQQLPASPNTHQLLQTLAAPACTTSTSTAARSRATGGSAPPTRTSCTIRRARAATGAGAERTFTNPQYHTQSPTANSRHNSSLQ